MTASRLGIDFGTSHTVAVLRHDDGGFAPLLFDGSTLLPSAVFAEPDGGILTGRDAVRSARLAPACFEPHPKRRVDDSVMLLGDREVPVVELFAAVLARVHEECQRVTGGIPSRVTITHPAGWGPTRRLVLEEAAAGAGFSRPRLLAEPVAAATYFAHILRHEVEPGSAVVVYDFGGGTFDASVVVGTDTEFEVRAVEGLDDLGGVDLDEAIVRHLGERFGDDPGWTSLVRPSTAEQRRQHRAFYEDVRAAKERLSRHVSAGLSVPLDGGDIHLTRDELETLTRPMLERAVTVTQAVIRVSRVPIGNITGVFLVGGASRMPLAATMLHRATRIPATVIEQPEVVVAQGAATPEPSPVGAAPTTPVSPVPSWPTAAPPSAWLPPPQPTPPTPKPGYPADAALPAPLRGIRNRALAQAVFGLFFVAYPFMGMTWSAFRRESLFVFLLQVAAAILPAGLAAVAAVNLGTRRRWVFGLALVSQLAQLGGVVGWLVLALVLRSAAGVHMRGTIAGLGMAVFVGVSAIIGVVRVAGRPGRAWWILPPSPKDPESRRTASTGLRSTLLTQVANSVATLGPLYALVATGSALYNPNPLESQENRQLFLLIGVFSAVAVTVCAVWLPRTRASRAVTALSVCGLALGSLYWLLWVVFEITVETEWGPPIDYFSLAELTPSLPFAGIGLVFAGLSVSQLYGKQARQRFDGPPPPVLPGADDDPGQNRLPATGSGREQANV